MRNYILCCLISLVGALGSQAQTVLDVPLSGQQQTKWCWAASAEMIAKYYSYTATTQCEILTTYIQQNTALTACSFSATCPCCKADTCPCNYPMPAGVGFMLGVLGSYSLTAIYSTTTLDWSVIKAEIDNCQPLMLRVGRHDFSADTDSEVDHFIVVAGYLEKDCSQFLLINDPWTPCEGCQYALDYTALAEGSATHLGIRTISQWFYGIKPTMWATGCPPPGGRPKPMFTEMELPCPPLRNPPRLPPSNPRGILRETLGSMRACFPMLTAGPVTIPAIEASITRKKSYSLRVILETAMHNTTQYQKPFDATRRQLFYWPAAGKRAPFEVIVQERHNRKRTLPDCPSQPETGGYWLIESFGRCSFFCATGTSCEGSSQVLVAKSKQAAKRVRVGKGGYPFGLVVYPAFRYTFRRFIYKQRTYYYSPTGYPDLLMADGTPFRANVAYSGSETLRQLHQRTNKSN